MPAANLPTGTVTFLFTDIEGSTKLWERYPEETRAALARHDQVIEEIVDHHGGSLVRPRGEGDSRFAVFARATDAVLAAAALQQMLYAEPWPTPTPLRVRVALHTGEADLRESDYYGSEVNRCARLRAAAHGGQTLLSQATYELVRHISTQNIEFGDLGEHLLKDLQRPEHIFQLNIPGLPSDFPPLKTLDARPNNLPSQRSRLVGREAELATVQRLLLGDGVGLLTLTGPGGIGKTRLALQAAAELIDEFRDGVFFVSLAPVSDPDLVASTIAHTLGLPEIGGQSLVNSLTEYLRGKQLLLVLDNFEQVVSAAPLITQLLAEAPSLKALVTSREVLHLYGEYGFQVPPLALPPALPGAQAPPHGEAQPAPLTRLELEQLTQYEAVRLFIERAVAVKTDFEITNENAPAVVEICRRLDGLPLAIELAAARVVILSPRAILSRLQSRLKLLTSSARDVPARQQTLRGTIEWSYSLLDEGEKLLFSLLSVFAGGFTLDAAEAVCNAEGDLQVDVFDSVASLVSKSLLVSKSIVQQTDVPGGSSGVDGEGGGEPRFFMLETIREYGLEQLEANANANAEGVRRAHACFYLDFAEQGELGLLGRHQIEWLNKLEADIDNLRAALGWSIERGGREGGETETETALRLTGALRHFWQIRSYLSEGHSWFESALRLPQAATYPSAKAKSLAGAALLAGVHGDFTTSRARAEESTALYRQMSQGDKLGLGYVLALLGIGGQANVAQDESIALLREAQTADADSPDGKWNLAVALMSSGGALGDESRRELARVRVEEARALFQELGDEWGLSQTLNFLGDSARLEGDYASAKRLYEQSLALYRKLGSKADIPASLQNQGHVALAMGKVEQAAALFREALLLQQEIGNKPGMLECLAGLAAVAGSARVAKKAGAREALERAARLFSAVYALRKALDASLWPTAQVDYERNLASVQARLEQAAWQSAWEEGRVMSIEQAIEYALEGTEVEA